MGKAVPSHEMEPTVIMLPKPENAKRYDDLNRKARRSHLARSQAGSPASKDKETGKYIPKRVRLKTQAANVAFARGVEKFGV